jgi:hypothetical protein
VTVSRRRIKEISSDERGRVGWAEEEQAAAIYDPLKFQLLCYVKKG